MLLSLCLAVYNEEKNLHYALNSISDLADEVIVVDGGSTDRTVEIARSYGPKVKIIQTDNPPMFHINKQKALEAAKGEWILQLDADEAVSEELKKEILDTIAIGGSRGRAPDSADKGALAGRTATDRIYRDRNQYVAYNIPRKNFFLYRFLMKGGQYPDYTIRLYRNGLAYFPCKDVHENVEIINQRSKIKDQNDSPRGEAGRSKFKNKKNVIPAKAGIQNKIGYLKNPILHYSDPTLSRYLKRWNRYNSLAAKKLHVTSYMLHRPIIFDYLIIKPITTFFSMFIRHKGFMDGLAGFIFAFFSSIRFWSIYFKFRSSQ